MDYLERVNGYAQVLKCYGSIDVTDAVVMAALWHLQEHMSQKEMAEILGIQQPYISRRLSKINELMMKNANQKVWNTDIKDNNLTVFGKRLSVVLESIVKELKDVTDDEIKFAPGDSFAI